jgi:dipeptidyl aminopeptidase/acylaminoacyl peptidase
MKISRCYFSILIGTALALMPILVNAEKIPMTAWIHDPLIASVNVSPDGNKLVALTLSNVNEAADITVWDTNNLSAPPTRFKPKKTKALFVTWLNDDKLFVIGRMKYDYVRGGRTTHWFRDYAYIVDEKGKRFRELFKSKEDDIAGVSLFDSLPQQPDKILVQTTNLEFAPDIYEVDLKSFTSKRIFRGATGESYFTDAKGEIRGRSEFQGGGESARIEFSYRNPNTNDWEIHHALYARQREGMEPAGFDNDGRSVYMRDNTGRDMNVIRKYDLIDRTLSDPIYADASFDATGVIQSVQPEDFGEVIGFTAQGEGSIVDYTSEEWAGLQQRIYSALPAGQDHRISSISDDFSIAVISSTGPKEPGAFYLLVGGSKLISLGRSMPYLEPENLADMTYVTYKARDGMEIPAYLTMPTTGDAPYPAVILPHGGPWARDSLRFDSWAQFLANRGYLVLQPQYRGSDGWGQELWRAGDAQWGGTMQDDKDDGAMWLVDQGLVDRDRMAMFGYSYGGYAAMAAIVRKDTPYQCAIAGAGLSELRYFDKVTFEGGYGREFQNPTIKGLSPLDQAKDASIPIFIFHGDRDQRVPIEQSRKYVSALKRAKKDVEYLEIPDLWHSRPWWPQHRLALFEVLEDYLGNRCGPGGL